MHNVDIKRLNEHLKNVNKTKNKSLIIMSLTDRFGSQRKSSS